MPDFSPAIRTEQRKCSVKNCSHMVDIAECRKMCERCRNTQAEQSRKKRQRKREKEDAAGTLIKRRAPSKPKPPLYRIPNVGLFTERDWPHLDERLFPKSAVQPEPQHPPPDRRPPVMRSDGYARSVPPAKDEGAKELVAVRICNIKGCYQPVPVERKLACIDCHERKAAYIQERKRKRDLEAANVITWNLEVPSQPSSLQHYCSVIQFDIDPSVQDQPDHASASNDETLHSQPTYIPPVLAPANHHTAPNADASHTLPADISPIQAPIHLPPIRTRDETVGISLSQAVSNHSMTEEILPADPFGIFPVDFFSSSASDAPQHQLSFERHHAPNAEVNNVITISPDCDDEDEDDVDMEEAEEETPSEVDSELGLDDLLLKACAAFRAGDEAEVKWLLEEGADVNAQGGWLGNALQAASYWGHKSIVQLLLEHGADINTQGGDYGNALQAACFDGAESVVKLLLDHGAELNAQGGEYGNALQAACFRGHESVVKLLLDHGTDVNAQSGEYGNALQAMSYWGYESVVKLLLDHGADVNAQGGKYGNALHAASTSGRKTVVKLLLEHGAIQTDGL